MKKQILPAIAIIAFLNVWAATNVSAQTGKTVKISVAFDFQAKDRIFPAGEYHIESVSRTGGDILSIKRIGGKNSGGAKNQLIVPNQLYAGKAQTPKLIFERRGANYFLKEIFLDSGQQGFSLPVPRPKWGENNVSVRSETIELPIRK